MRQPTVWGAMLGVATDRDDVEISLHALAEDFDEVLGLAAEILRTPTFPDEELEIVRQQALTGLREQETDTSSMASRAMREQLYPEGHPYRIPASGDLDSVAGLSRSQLEHYHRRTFSPDRTTIAVVGGLPDLESISERIWRVLGDWVATSPETLDVAPINPPESVLRQRFDIPGKSQADIAIGYPTVHRSLDRSWFALHVGNVILGQLGLMGRLGANVREEQGLAYYASSSIGGSRSSSIWAARAGVDPANVDQAIEAIADELGRMRRELVTEAELADAKSYVIGVQPLGLESLGGVVNLLLAIERYGLGLDYVDRFPPLINAVTREDVLETARELLDERRLAIGIAGPPEGDSSHA